MTASDQTLDQLLGLALARNPEASPSASGDRGLATFLRSVAQSEVARPIDRALFAAVRAPTPALAIAAAHQSAIRQLFPDLPPDDIIAVCVTERDGNSPRAIRSRLRRAVRNEDRGVDGGAGHDDDDGTWRLDGAKRWATLSPVADRLLVVAVRDWIGERADLVVVSVDPASAGVTVEIMAAGGDPLGLPHATIDLADVRVERTDILCGDAHEVLVKPFRLLEDLYGAAVAAACRLRLALAFEFPTAQGRARAGTDQRCARACRPDVVQPRGPSRNRRVLSLARAAAEQACDSSAELDAPTYSLWRPFLEPQRFAEVAREARRQRAWQRTVGGDSPSPRGS